MQQFVQNQGLKRSMLRAAGLLAVLACFLQPVMAQRTVSGKITDAATGEALNGASVIVKGTTAGAIADAQGMYRVSVPGQADSLVFSFLGYARTTVAIGNRTTIDLAMTEEVKQAEEVVITALGVARAEKALGYAVQEVDGEGLTKARETNLATALAGKVAGVTVVGTPSGVGSSARITIRGEKSLDINKNQPLYVIDGVPILNEFIGSSGRSRQEADYGNPAQAINPDDIESITVLKGANASALYGSRAANGVILITTKSGKNTKGIGVTINSTTSFETPLVLPEYQNVYGQGLNGEFGFVDGGGGGTRDGVDESWGPKMEGQLIAQHNSPRLLNGQPTDLRGADVLSPGVAGTTIQPTAFLPQPNNVRDFFEVGQTRTNNIALTGSNERGNFRLSYTNLDQIGMVPNTDLRRNSLALNTSYNLTNKFSVSAVVNYIKTDSDNRPNNSYGTENIMYLFNCWLGRHVNLEELQDYWQTGLDGRQQYNFNYNYHDNPYFNLFENTNGQNASRVFGNLVLKYEFTDWLSLQLRSATDFNSELRTRRRAFSTQRFPFGSYGEETIYSEESNTDALLTFNKTFGDFGVNVSLGANRMNRALQVVEVVAPQLLIPGIYSLANTRVELQSSQYGSRESIKRILSAYGFAGISYRNAIFLDVTARNDWSSALPTGSNAYFYPSASLSVVLSDLVTLPDAINFVKLRGGVAQVGNDTDPYQLLQAYGAAGNFGTFRIQSEASRLANPDLKPEISTSLEVGADVRLLNNRLGVDFTFYNINSRNQILLDFPLSITTGYGSRVVNAGNIRNWGYEAMLNIVPVKMENGLRWDLDLNFSANRSRVIELTDEIQNYVLASRYVTVEARVGERMGEMYGLGYERVQNTDPDAKYYDPTGNFVGEIVLDSRGRPVRTTTRIPLGNYNPDWLLGIQNSFEFKGVSFGFLFDMRQGGRVYSHTQTVGREGGQIIETLEGRADGYDLTKEGNGVYFDGVFVSTGANGENVFTANDPAANQAAIKLSAREYHSAFTQGRSLIEGVMYDASFTKLREVRLGYTLPNSIFGKTSIRNVQISAVGRNLFVWSKVPHIDPETSSISGGTIIPGVESVAIPSARSFGFNLSLNL
ncbi:MAG: SusC/RagA family TonB-linked outer membrane protein [Bacteroidia bacterium]|nr:SusC/RagA family TonB-linked outer membrane protein [Bacteroidia bacterium]